MSIDIKTLEKIRDDELVSQIKSLLEGKIVLSYKSNPFFGKITVVFNDGMLTHVEKYETIK